MLLNIIVQTMIKKFIQDYLINRKFKKLNLFEIKIFWSNVNAFSIIFDQLNASLPNKRFCFFNNKKNLPDPKPLNSKVKLIFWLKNKIKKNH